MTTTKTTKAAKVEAKTGPVTGLGETWEEICVKCEGLAEALLGLVGKGAKGKEAEILNAAYAYGVAERRRRKLSRKVNGHGEKAEE